MGHIALVEANALPKAPEFYDLPVAPQDTPEVAAAKAEHMKAVEAALAGQTYAPTYTHTAPPAEVKIVEAPAAVTSAYAGYGYPAGYGYAAGYGYNAYAAGYGYAGYGYPYGYAGAYPAAYSAYTPYAGYAGYGYAAHPVTTAHAVQ